MWECGACERLLCPTCKETRPYWKGGPVDGPNASQDGRAEGQGEGRQALPQEADEMSLANIFEQMPACVAVSTPDGVPKRAKARMGKLGTKLLGALLTCIAAGGNDALLQEKADMLNLFVCRHSQE